MEQENQSLGDEVKQWLTFSIENESYGIEVLRVIEILSVRDLAPIPGASHHVLGFLSLRGQVVIVNNIRLLLGLSDIENTDQSRIILLDANGQTRGILVDGVSEIMSVKTAGIDSASSHGGDYPFITGTYPYEQKLIILISADKLLKESEET